MLPQCLLLSPLKLLLRRNGLLSGVNGRLRLRVVVGLDVGEEWSVFRLVRVVGGEDIVLVDGEDVDAVRGRS